MSERTLEDLWRRETTELGRLLGAERWVRADGHVTVARNAAGLWAVSTRPTSNNVVATAWTLCSFRERADAFEWANRVDVSTSVDAGVSVTHSTRWLPKYSTRSK